MTAVPKTLEEVIALLMKVVAFIEADDDRGAQLQNDVVELTDDVRDLDVQIAGIEARLFTLEADA